MPVAGGTRPTSRRAQHRGDPRAANEQVLRRAAGTTRLLPFRCECAAPGCTAVVRMPAEEFAAILRLPGRYVVASGHFRDDSEVVVGRGQGHLLVEAAPAEHFLG